MSTFAVCFNRICEMDLLPKDPAILVSSVNMLLRDEEFDTLESLCYRSNLFACLSKNFGTEPMDKRITYTDMDSFTAISRNSSVR